MSPNTNIRKGIKTAVGNKGSALTQLHHPKLPSKDKIINEKGNTTQT
jgi:hypothetical protein